MSGLSRVLRYLVFALLTALVISASPGMAQQGAKDGEWRSYAGDAGSTRYAPYDQINRDNVKNLQVAWSWKFDNFGGGTSETTPIMANGILYFTVGPRRNVIAVNPGTGETLWTWRPDEGARFDQAPRKVGRGVAYWTDGTDARIITVTPGFQLVALNAKTGVPVREFGKDGSVDLFTQLDLTTPIDPIGKIGNSSAPVVSNDVIVIGPALTQGGTSPNKENVKGDVMAFDVRTGKKLWVFHTIPRKGEPGYETWLNGSAEYTGNVGRVGSVLGRRRAGIRVPRHRIADQRRIRRTSSRRQSVFRLAGLPRYQDRQDDLVQAAHSPRHLGLRHAGASDPARHQRRRTADQGRRPDGEDGVRVRVRSHERPAGVADSRCPGASDRRADRMDRRQRSRFPASRRPSTSSASRKTT